jgi:hypothetical protein
MHDCIKDAFAIRATVYVVTQKIKNVVMLKTDLLQKSAEGLAAAVYVTYCVAHAASLQAVPKMDNRNNAGMITYVHTRSFILSGGIREEELFQ